MMLSRIHQRFALMVALLIVAIAPGALGKRIRKGNDPAARPFSVRNLSPSHVGVYWINLSTEERVLQFELVSGASEKLNSHAIHEFEIREIPNDEGKCSGKKGKCRKKYFQITEDEDQVFTIESNFAVTISNTKIKARERARDALKGCRDLRQFSGDEVPTSPVEQLNRLTQCLQHNVQDSIYNQQEELEFQADVRRKMGAQLKTYACNDPDSSPTEPFIEKEWNPNNPRLKFDDNNHTVKVLLQTETMMVALIDNIVTAADCHSMNVIASGNEADHTVVPWDSRKEPETLDLLTKIYAYVNPAAKLMSMYAGLSEKGQEIFKFYHESSEHPEAKALANSADDIWPVQGPHFARLLMFCEVSDENGGGAIHFPESGVHVHPKLGEGLLISYARPPEGLGRNEKFTNEHTECPILSGSRTILQHVFRLFPEWSE